MGHLHFIDGEAPVDTYPDIPVLYLSINCFSSLSFLVSCLSPPQLSYDCSPSRLVDLVGFVHVLIFVVQVLSPRSPHPLQFHAYISCYLFPCPEIFSLVGCSLYFYLLFGLLSIPRISCRCCDGHILTRTKVPPHFPKA